MAQYGTTRSKMNVFERGALALQYLNELKLTLDSVSVSDAAERTIPIDVAFGAMVDELESAALPPSMSKILLIGNGGSAAIASHVATDYMKNGGFRTYSFADASLITCLANDFGYEHAYEKAVERLALPADILIAISSSGKSPNIVNAVDAACQLGASVVTFTGFDADNPIRKKGHTNFYVPSHSYPAVEASHMAILDAILQASIRARHTP